MRSIPFFLLVQLAIFITSCANDDSIASSTNDPINNPAADTSQNTGDGNQEEEQNDDTDNTDPGPDADADTDTDADADTDADNHDHDHDHDHDHGGGDGDSTPTPIEGGGVRHVKDENKQLIVDQFDLKKDKIELGSASIHNQIPVDTKEGIKFQNLFNSNYLLIKNVYLHQLQTANFFPIADAHLQQDLSAAMAWENGEALVRDRTVYIRSHEEGKTEVFDFDPAQDKINFMYLSVRGDDQTNFSVEQTTAGVRFFSPITKQSILLKNITFADLKNSNFEWRANQLEDNIATRMGLSQKISNFKIINENVFSGKSIANAGGVDRAPYHQYNYSKYTGTPRKNTQGFEN